MSVLVHDKPLFDGVVYFIDPSVPPRLTNSLNNVLIANGAQAASGPSEDLTTTDVASSSQSRFDLLVTTHIITNTLDMPEYRNLGTEHQHIGNVLVVDFSERSDEDSNILHNPSDSRRHSRQINSRSTTKRYIKIVTPKWVTQSYDTKSLHPTECYSSAPSKIFSGLLIALDSTTELPPGDLDIIEATVIAWGGQFTKGWTTGTTHVLFDGNSSETDLRSRMKRGAKVVLPHWFHVCTLLHTIVPEGPFQFPTPPILEFLESTNEPSEWKSTASSSGTLKHSPTPLSAGSAGLLNSLMDNLRNDANFADFLKNRQSAQEENGMNDHPSIALTNPIHPELEGKRVYLVSSLEMNSHSRATFVERVRQTGADVFDAQSDDPSWKTERDVSDTDAQTALSDADFVICDSRSGWEFWLAWELKKTIGTLRWITAILSITNPLHRRIRPPLKRFFDYPIPPRMISGWHPKKNLVTITNYSGFSRTWLIRLIEKMGLKYDGTLSSKTCLLVAENKSGQKVAYASKSGIPIVNHLYIEDCFRSWSKMAIESLHRTYPKDGSLFEPNGEAGYTFEIIQNWTHTSAAIEERKAVLQEYRSRDISDTNDNESKEFAPRSSPGPDTTALEDEDLTIELDQMDLDEIPHPDPLSDLMMCEESSHIRKPFSENTAELNSSKKTTLRDLSDDQSMNGSVSSLPSGSITDNTTKRLVVADGKFTDERGNGNLSTTSAPSEPGPPRSSEGTPDTDEKDSPEDRLVYRATKPTNCSKRSSGMDVSKSGYTDGEAHRPHKRLRSSLDHLINERPSNEHDSDASRNNSPSLQLPNPDREKETAKFDEINDEDVSFNDITKTNSSKAVANATKSVNCKDSTNTSRTSDTKKVPQRRHSDTPKRANDAPIAGASQSIKRASTRMTAKKSAAKVADCAADMLIHEKEKKRKVSSGAGLAGTSNGGYFGDVGAKPPSASKNRSGEPRSKITRGRSLDDTDQARPVVLASKSAPGRIKVEDEDADSPSLSKLRYRKDHMSDRNPEDRESGSEWDDDIKSGNGTVKQSKSNRCDAKSRLPSRKNTSKAGLSSNIDELMRSDVRILQTVIRLDKKLIQKLEKLGASVTDEVATCTHLVTNKIYRNVKFIQAIILGVHIVDQKWTEACVKAGELIEPDDYLLNDEHGEMIHGFSLQESLARAREGKLLTGETFYVSPSVKPDFETIKELIELADGKVIATKPLVRNIRENTGKYVISCAEDYTFWKALMKKKPKEEDVPIYTSEVILAGLLTQNMIYDGDKSQLDTQKIMDQFSEQL